MNEYSKKEALVKELEEFIKLNDSNPPIKFLANLISFAKSGDFNKTFRNACAYGNDGVALALVKMMFKPEYKGIINFAAPGADGKTGLDHAIAKNNSAVHRFLIDKIDPNTDKSVDRGAFNISWGLKHPSEIEDNSPKINTQKKPFENTEAKKTSFSTIANLSMVDGEQMYSLRGDLSEFTEYQEVPNINMTMSSEVKKDLILEIKNTEIEVLTTNAFANILPVAEKEKIKPEDKREDAPENKPEDTPESTDTTLIVSNHMSEVPEVVKEPNHEVNKAKNDLSPSEDETKEFCFKEIDKLFSGTINIRSKFIKTINKRINECHSLTNFFTILKDVVLRKIHSPDIFYPLINWLESEPHYYPDLVDAILVKAEKKSINMAIKKDNVRQEKDSNIVPESLPQEHSVGFVEVFVKSTETIEDPEQIFIEEHSVALCEKRNVEIPKETPSPENMPIIIPEKIVNRVESIECPKQIFIDDKKDKMEFFQKMDAIFKDRMKYLEKFSGSIMQPAIDDLSHFTPKKIHVLYGERQLLKSGNISIVEKIEKCQSLEYLYKILDDIENEKIYSADIFDAIFRYLEKSYPDFGHQFLEKCQENGIKIRLVQKMVANIVPCETENVDILKKMDKVFQNNISIEKGSILENGDSKIIIEKIRNCKSLTELINVLDEIENKNICLSEISHALVMWLEESHLELAHTVLLKAQSHNIKVPPTKKIIPGFVNFKQIESFDQKIYNYNVLLMKKVYGFFCKEQVIDENNSTFFVGSRIPRMLANKLKIKDIFNHYDWADLDLRTCLLQDEALIKVGVEKNRYIHDLYVYTGKENFGKKIEIIKCKEKEALISDFKPDFTICGLMIDDKGNLIDVAGNGISDLKSKTLCTIGDSYSRIVEDPLIIIRAIKYELLGFKLSDELRSAINKWIGDQNSRIPNLHHFNEKISAECNKHEGEKEILPPRIRFRESFIASLKAYGIWEKCGLDKIIHLPEKALVPSVSKPSVHSFSGNSNTLFYPGAPSNMMPGVFELQLEPGGETLVRKKQPPDGQPPPGL